MRLQARGVRYSVRTWRRERGRGRHGELELFSFYMPSSCSRTMTKHASYAGGGVQQTPTIAQGPRHKSKLCVCVCGGGGETSTHFWGFQVFISASINPAGPGKTKNT